MTTSRTERQVAGVITGVTALVCFVVDAGNYILLTNLQTYFYFYFVVFLNLSISH